MSVRSSWSRWLKGLTALLVLAIVIRGGGWLHEHTIKPLQHPSMCVAHLKQLSLALHNYHDHHQRFPPAYTLGSDGAPWHSWRVLILPELGEQKLFDAYRFDEPWNGPNNIQLADHMPNVFGFPGEAGAKFLAVTGQYTAWPNHRSSRMSEFYMRGTSNSLMLVESADSDVNWLEPRDISHAQAMKQGKAEAAPRLAGRHGQTTFLTADGETHFGSKPFHERGLALMLSVGPTGETHAAAPADFPSQRNASSLARTDVLPVPTMQISPDRNYLYCATFRIAWDQLRQSPAAPVTLDPLPPIAAELNRLPYALENLDPESYFAATVDAADVEKMNNALHQRFPSAGRPATTPVDEHGQGRILFAYLLKSLPFADEMDGNTPPLLFPDGSTETRVASFGGWSSLIHIADYRTDADFIIELKTESERDVMLLAKIPAGATMQETIDKILKRITSPNPLHTRFSLEAGEIALIPKLSFNIMKSYDDLLRKQIVDSPVSEEEYPEFISRADQATAFVLNERGGKLESTVVIETTISDFGDDEPAPPPPKIRKFHFDRPFLVLLREQQSHDPYFAVWIANSELMLPMQE